MTRRARLQRRPRGADAYTDVWLDATALVILGLFAGMGALRGGLAAGLQLATLLAAYGAALLAGSRLAGRAAAAFGVPELAGGAIAGTLAFLASFVALGVLAAWVRRARRPVGGEARSPRDRFLGGVCGALRGAFAVLLLSWLALWTDALRATGVVESLPAVEGSRAAELTSAAVESGFTAALADSGVGGRIAARIAARPGRALVGIQELVADPRLDGLREDRLFWSQVEHGAVDAALNRGSFLELGRDAALRERLVELGVIEPEAARDATAFREVAADALREVGPRIRGLRGDPALRRLLEDPEVVAALESGESWRLLGHSGFRELVTRVAARN
jgi:hypothetical protein